MAEMTLLQLTTEFCKRQGLPQPTSVVNASDDTTQQILGLFNEGIADICDRFVWPGRIIKIDSFIHADGGNFTALDFNTQYQDFKALIPHTLWNNTTRQEVAGPVSAEDWTAMTVMLITPALYSYRLYTNALHIFPIANAFHSFTMEYLSRYGVFSPTAAANTELYTEDISYPLLPSYLILADIKWRWRREKGLPYAEDQRACEEQLINYCGRLETAELYMDNTNPWDKLASPGLYVAAGSWHLP